MLTGCLEKTKRFGRWCKTTPRSMQRLYHKTIEQQPKFCLTKRKMTVEWKTHWLAIPGVWQSPPASGREPGGVESWQGPPWWLSRLCLSITWGLRGTGSGGTKCRGVPAWDNPAKCLAYLCISLLYPPKAYLSPVYSLSTRHTHTNPFRKLN